MKKSNTDRARLLLAKIEKEMDSKRIVAFKDSLVVSKEFYGSLEFLVRELGWNTLVETKEFRNLSNLVIALAHELKEKKRAESFKAASSGVKMARSIQKEKEQEAAQEASQVEGQTTEAQPSEPKPKPVDKENRFKIKTHREADPQVQEAEKESELKQGEANERG